MASDDMVKCPLCRGQARVSRAELMALLTDKNLQGTIANYLADLSSASSELAEESAGRPGGRDFQKQVHSWNPQLPIWRRSPKE